MTEKLRAFCPRCNAKKEIDPIELRKDKYNKEPWGDVVCKDCGFVIATLFSSKEGVVEFRELEK